MQFDTARAGSRGTVFTSLGWQCVGGGRHLHIIKWGMSSGSTAADKVYQAHKGCRWHMAGAYKYKYS